MVKVAALSDKGRKRQHNQDAFLLNEQKNLFLLADGMGGHAAGGVASKLTLETIAEFVKLVSSPSAVTWPFGYDVQGSFQQNVLKTAARLANDRVCQEADRQQTYAGMGSTLVCVWLDGATAHHCHVGDSRLYLLRGGELSKITEDHSLVQEQLRLGLISPEEARTHTLKHVVTRAIGSRESFESEVGDFQLENGDLLMLCCDGLTDELRDEEILEIVDGVQDLDRACRNLVEAANQAGGEDNITVVLARFTDSDPR